jgi:hypothetical protein
MKDFKYIWIVGLIITFLIVALPIVSLVSAGPGSKNDRGSGDDQLCYIFDSALGARNPAAEPDLHDLEIEYIPKVKLEDKRAPTSGGCG